MSADRKPLGRRAYGSIPHLPGSRLGPGDHHIHEGQDRICTERARPGDRVLVTPKLDGTNVAVAKVKGEVVALIRAGYRCSDSPRSMHIEFDHWVGERRDVFADVLREGERVCGEWLAQAHGTLYDLTDRDPFVVFDLFTADNQRTTWDAMVERVTGALTHVGAIPGPMPVPRALAAWEGWYGALTPSEGVVYRVERGETVDFLAKFVKQDKVDGLYLQGDQEVRQPGYAWATSCPPYVWSGEVPA